MSRSNRVFVGADATEVLGEYNHSLTIPSDEDFVIIYGPNGVGKTKFLEIVHSASQLNGFSLQRLPFSSATLKYSDGSTLQVERSSGETGSGTELESQRAVQFSLTIPGKSQISWRYEDDEFIDFIRRTTPYEPISGDVWQDPSDGELVHTAEIRARYGSRFRGKVPDTSSAPDEMRTFVGKTPSFLIETQRLRTENLGLKNQPRIFGLPRSNGKSQSRIVEQAENIKSLLNDAQTEHSRITQRLDRTFPNRVLSAVSQNRNLDAGLIRERYDDQNDFRSRLGRVASVSLSEELALPEGDLDPWALALLDLYLEDAKTKLRPFEELLEKIELLQTIINDRLLKKQLTITDIDGLTVAHSESGRTIALESLSSGEQHEIILMIDLLFHVPPGAMVLIDEPEISLHVAWQLAFLPDVKRIADLVGFRFVVATHSPQIINNDWDRATRLGPSEAKF